MSWYEGCFKGASLLARMIDCKQYSHAQMN